MLYAKRFPEPTEPAKRGRGNKTAEIGGTGGVPHQRIAEARAIIADDRNDELVADVLAGALKLGLATARWFKFSTAEISC